MPDSIKTTVMAMIEQVEIHKVIPRLLMLMMLKIWIVLDFKINMVEIEAVEEEIMETSNTITIIIMVVAVAIITITTIRKERERTVYLWAIE